MSTNQKQKEGANITVAAPSGGVVSGTAYLIGGLFGVAVATAAQTESVVLCTKGVFNLTKLATDVVAVGDVLYWDNTNKRLTKTSATGLFQVGVATAAAGNGVATVDCRLDGVSVLAVPA